MGKWTIDILEPDDDINIAVDNLGNEIGKLYAESWREDKEPHYKKPFSLNVAAFAQMWYAKTLKIFIAYDERHEPVGYLIGMVFRPLPYEASIFKVEDWYTRGDTRLEEALFAHAAQAIRYIGCDELWVADDAGDRIPPVPVAWVEENKFTLRRYKKK